MEAEQTASKARDHIAESGIGKARSSELHGRHEMEQLHQSLNSNGKRIDGHNEDSLKKGIQLASRQLEDYELVKDLLLLSQPKSISEAAAKRLIKQFRNFGRIITAETRLLEEVPGVCRSSVAVFKLVHASAIRLARSELTDGPVFSNWFALKDYLIAVLARERVEQVRVLFLDSRNRLISDEVLWRGTINHTPVYPREIVKRALVLESYAIILSHNHPSGDPTPSRDDILMTHEITAAARTLSIVVYDHVIVGNGICVSLRESGLLNKLVKSD